MAFLKIISLNQMSMWYNAACGMRGKGMRNSAHPGAGLALKLKNYFDVEEEAKKIAFLG